MGCGVFLGSALQLHSLRFWFCARMHVQVHDHREEREIGSVFIRELHRK